MVYKNLWYLDFWEKLIEVFGKPEMATAKLQDLSKAYQDVSKPITDYMNRMRLLVIRANPDFCHKKQKRILVTNFQFGLRDHELATLLPIANSQHFLRRQKHSETLLRVNRLRTIKQINKSYSYYMFTDYQDEHFEEKAAGCESIFYDAGN